MKDPEMNKSIRISLRSVNLQSGVTIAAILIALKNAESPIPFYKARSNKIKYATIGINGKKTKTIKLESIQDTAIKTLKDDYNRLRGKVAASIVVKAGASIAAGLVAKRIAKSSKKTAGFAGLIGYAAGMGTASALFSQMKPDLRCWHTLPASLQLGKVFLKPGKHKISLAFIGGSGAIGKKRIFNVEIKKDKKSFINNRSLY